MASSGILILRYYIVETDYILILYYKNLDV